MLLSRPLRYAAHGAAALVVAAGSVGVAHYDKAVALSVDGKSSSVHVFGSTVADVLDKQGITLGEHDVVIPSLGSSISDGDRIAVRYGRKLTVTVDGVTKEYWTTATTVDAALQDIGLRADGAVLSASRSQSLGREGLRLQVTTPKSVTVVADGKTRTLASTKPRVADALAELGVKLGARDLVSPAVATPLKDGLKVVVKRVSVTRQTTNEAVAFRTVTEKDSSIFEGETEVETRGKAGTVAVTREVTRTDGKVTATKVVARKVVAAPVDKVVKVGTKERPAPEPEPSRATRPSTSSSSGSSSSSSSSSGSTGSSGSSGAGINLARAAMWDRIAQCESSGNWSINTGNGYYGGLQFATASWLANGGDDFAPRADLASRAEQITVANRYYEKAGLSPWGCAHAA